MCILFYLSCKIYCPHHAVINDDKDTEESKVTLKCYENGFFTLIFLYGFIHITIYYKSFKSKEIYI